MIKESLSKVIHAEWFAILWGSEISILMSVSLPIFLFIKYGWEVRKQEFTNQLFSPSSGDTNERMRKYFERYWQGAVFLLSGQQAGFYKRMEVRDQQNIIESRTDRDRFDILYDVMNGKKWYLPPTILLLVLMFIFSGLVISTAIRMGHIQFRFNVLSEGLTSREFFVPDVPDGVLFPFSSNDISLPAIAALGGGYLYIMTILIRGYRSRSLVSSDIWWCCVRLVLAIPLGFSLGQVASSSVGVFIAFGLGAFPTGALIVLIRRLLTSNFNQSEKDNTNDEIIKLVGISPNTAAVIADEGIESIQQLASADPISLALRSGLSASYMMFIVSQAHAWKLLGQIAQASLDYGVCDATFIKETLFREDYSPTPAGVQAIKAISQTKNMDETLVLEKLKNVARDPYTDFLCVFQ